jgi:hypothetical protein
MFRSLVFLVAVALALPGIAQTTNAARILSPTSAIKPEGTWSLGARAGDFIFVASMPGVFHAPVRK